jgi:hypothetical protein
MLLPALSLTLLSATLPVATAQPVRSAAAAAAPVGPPALLYADLADLALAAPVVAHVRLRRALALRPQEAVGVPAGFTRFYMEAELVALIRGEAGTPAQVKYVGDLPNQPNGRAARPARRAEYLIFARPVAGRAGELQLVATDAQIAFSAAAADRARAILREMLSPDAPQAVTGIGRAFHVPGVLQGSSETQIFLLTGRNQPISITVRREPNVEPRWFVSLSEFVDAGATQPTRDTLLWYRLACFLPAQLPASSLSETPEHAGAIAADYSLVRAGLGPCRRQRARR